MHNLRKISGSEINLGLIEDIGSYNINSVQSIEEHKHKSIELIYVLSGQHNLRFPQGDTITITGGHFCIIQGNRPHKPVDGIITPASLVWIKIKPVNECDFSNSSLTKEEYSFIYTTLKNEKLALHTISKKCQVIIGWISHFLKNTDLDTTDLSRAELRSAIYDLLIDTANFSGRDVNKSTFPIEEIKEYINHHISDHISVTELAHYIGYNVTWLQKKFKAITGIKLWAYIQKTRIDLAKNLLTQTDENITKIAGYCGFNSSQYFATTFLKLTNTTPSQFRTSNRKTNDSNQKSSTNLL